MVPQVNDHGRHKNCFRRSIIARFCEVGWGPCLSERLRNNILRETFRRLAMAVAVGTPQLSSGRVGTITPLSFLAEMTKQKMSALVHL